MNIEDNRLIPHEETTTIEVKRTTWRRLTALGVKKDSFDDIVQRLLDQAGRKRGK